MRKQTLLFLTTLFFALALSGAVFADDPTDNATNQSSNIVILGSVEHCSDGEPFPGVTVSVSENGQQIASTTTQSDGSYTMTLPFTESLLQVTASSPGHNPVTNELQFTENSQSAVLNFVLGMDEVWISDSTGDDDTGLGTEASPYKTLRKGIKETNSGGTLHVLDGTYTGPKNRNLEIKKSISIIGQSQVNTIINAKGLDWIFDVYGPGFNVLFSKLTLKNAYIDYDGGAAIFSNEGSTVTVSECSFIDNYVGHGLLDYYNGGAIYNEDGNLIVTDCLFKGNYASRHGGAIYSKNGDVTVTDSIFKKNKARKDGGAIYNKKGDLTITGSIFKKNKARRDGGAIYHEQGALTVTESMFKKNIARNVGGAIFNDGDLTCNNCDFKFNSAEMGGAIANDDNGKLTCNDCDFTYNLAVIEGGAIYNWDGELTCNKCDFTENAAVSGGAIGNNGSEGLVTCNKCDFTENAAVSGGAIFNIYDGILTCNKCDFTDNKAFFGGAINNWDGELTCNKCDFNGNTADAGGAIYIGDGTATCDKCDFNENTADYGGAIYNLGDLSCTYCDFINNTADIDGGAIYNAFDTVTVIGSNFINNTATSGDGGALKNYNGDFILNFNRIIGNTAGGEGQDIFDENNDPADTHNALYNWWGSNAGPADGRIGFDQLDLVEYDPWLVMRYNANPTRIQQGKTSKLTADFRYDSDGTFHNPVLGHIPNDLPVTFTTTLGNVGSKSVIKYTLNGVATATLRGDEAAGAALTSATLDNQTLYSTVTITPKPTVNAAGSTKTIGMQKTGLPILPLVIAGLMLVGGLIAPRRIK